MSKKILCQRRYYAKGVFMPKEILCQRMSARVVLNKESDTTLLNGLFNVLIHVVSGENLTVTVHSKGSMRKGFTCF